MSTSPFVTLAELAEWVSGVAEGDPSLQITGVGEPGRAGSGDIVLVTNAATLGAAEAGEASALLIPEEFPSVRRPAIRVRNVRLAFARTLQRFAPAPALPRGIHRSAVLGTDVALEEGVRVGAHVVLGDRVRIGRNTILLPGVVVGDDVVIGADGLIYPNVTIRERSVLGDRVILHAGVVIGSDGFGYAESERGPVKIPHLGRVVIGDDVEIGANTTIDRGTLGETRIGQATKIDNLVQVAHNVQIGRGVMIVAQVGLSGSVTIGDGAILAGQSGVPDHVAVGPRARLLARAVPTKDVPAGETVLGFPARGYREELRLQASLRRVPDLLAALASLERRVEGLEAARGRRGGAQRPPAKPK